MSDQLNECTYSKVFVYVSLTECRLLILNNLQSNAQLY